MRTYVNRNLWQYERSFNPTSTASRLMSVHPPHRLRPLQLNSLPTTCNHLAKSPSPLLRDVGLIDSAPSRYRNTDPSHICPSPLQRDVGGSTTLDGGVRERWTQGGAKQWEAHLVRHWSDASDHICSTPTFRPTLAYRIRHGQPLPWSREWRQHEGTRTQRRRVGQPNNDETQWKRVGPGDVPRPW